MRIALVLLLGCTDPDPARDVHAITTCDAGWNVQASACERACVAPMVMTGDYCKGTNAQGRTLDCSNTFEYEGVIGCCIPYPVGGDEHEVRFFVCD
jgi:hypothetical protein